MLINRIKFLSIMVCFFFISFDAVSKDYIDKNIILSADIETSKFFSFNIKEFYFEDRNLDIDVDFRRNKLIDKSTYLVLKTDIPSSFPSGYIITSDELSSFCFDQKWEKHEDIARYYLDGIRLKKDLPVYFDDFSKKGTFLQVRKPFNIEFNTINDFELKTSRCEGKVVLRAQLNI
ncbi:TPA: hypothetical protein ACX6S1_002793 [Photobacterium damselae]